MLRMGVSVRAESAMPWWRPLVQWVLCVPHLLWAGVLSVASGVVTVGAGLVLLVTGRLPVGAVRFQALVLRERVRAYSCFFLLRSDIPPLATAATALDPGDDPLVRVEATGTPAPSRWSLLTRGLVVLPHVLVLVPVGVAMDLCYPLWAIGAAVNRGWPPGVERFLVQVEGWVGAIIAYVSFASDERPTFGLAAYDAPQPWRRSSAA